ncbi:MAG TPA: hypothetical protein VJ483_00625, partial [Holophagaceae bacterium]|nr:hypothetical protein [Holophagaceae bacterium]
GRLVLEAIAKVHRELGTTVAIITHNAAIADMGTRIVRLAGGGIAEDRLNARRREPRELEW